ncbi:alpha/beta hydrolase [uncultured Arcticibacterium sp.]|uniref:alpha/beta hydrolase n=1 Tax=uncultured Arcticibacterium sp. TaxID=2173042 RepID=UPI0030F8A583
MKTIPRKHLFLLLLISVLAVSSVYSQERIVYKQIDSTSLFMDVYRPANFDASKKYPAMVFFFGGGWNGGSVKQFEPHAKYFAKRGMICFLVDYRVASRQHTTPFESLKDAKSAIRFIKEQRGNLQVDTSMIVAAGGSAGGHLAAATALINDYNEDTDNLKTSAVPNALVLFNPVIDNGPGGYGFERIRNQYKNFSPLHNIQKGTPPTIIFLGSKDHLIPVETMQYYKTVMTKVNSRCDLHLYDEQGHGFFNYAKFEFYKKTIHETDAFLKSLGFLRQKPLVEIE